MTTNESSTVANDDTTWLDLAEGVAVFSGFLLFVSPVLTSGVVSIEVVLGTMAVLYGIAGYIRLVKIRRSRDAER